jgi:hypothetical protein
VRLHLVDIADREHLVSIRQAFVALDVAFAHAATDDADSQFLTWQFVILSNQSC